MSTTADQMKNKPDLAIARIGKWRSPASEYPRKRSGSAQIKTAWYKPGVYNCYKTREFDFFRALKRLYITILTIDGETWMVDDPPHWWAMEEHAEALQGHVLCAGLGLGLMVHALNKCEQVEHITVVERSPDVIDLVGPLVPHDKLTIINDDFFELSTDAIAPVDGVLFDLFVGTGSEFLSDAVSITAETLMKWDDPTVRVHGLPNPWVENAAKGLLAANLLFEKS